MAVNNNTLYKFQNIYYGTYLTLSGSGGGNTGGGGDTPPTPTPDPRQGEYDTAKENRRAAYDNYIALLNEEIRLKPLVEAAKDNRNTWERTKNNSLTELRKRWDPIVTLESSVPLAMQQLDSGTKTALSQAETAIGNTINQAKATIGNNMASLVAHLAQQLELLTTETKSKLAASQLGLDSICASLKEFANAQWNSLHQRVNRVYNFLTGLRGTVEALFTSVFALHRDNALKAQEYDGLTLTAALYKDKEVPALQYDLEGKIALS